MLATVVDIDALLKVVAYSFLVGVGVTLSFSFAILGATRFAETRRDGRLVAAGVFGLVVALGLAASVAAIALGVVELTANK